MKFKSALIMLICCIICIVYGIADICKYYTKLKKNEINLKKFTLIVVGIIYATTLSGFASYSYYTGLYSELLSALFMIFWIFALYVSVRTAFNKKSSSIKVTTGRLIFLFLVSCFCIYISLDDFYSAVYIPYFKNWLNMNQRRRQLQIKYAIKM